MMTPTTSNGSDDAIRRALQILAGMSGGGVQGYPQDIGGSTPSGGGAIGNAASQAGGGGTTSGGGTSGGGTGGASLPPQLEALLNMMLSRMQMQDPLFQSVTNQALWGLPKYAQTLGLGNNGGGGSNIFPGTGEGPVITG